MDAQLIINEVIAQRNEAHDEILRLRLVIKELQSPKPVPVEEPI